MNRKKIFCEKSFLERFLNEKPEESFLGDPEYQHYDNWRKLFKLLQTSDTTVGCSESFISNNVDNVLLRKLLKCKTDGYCDFMFMEAHFPKLSSLKHNASIEQLAAVYLTGTDLHDTARWNGVINISIDDIPTCERYFNDNGDVIGKGDQLSWNVFEKQLRHNCNSMVFVDNYGLKSMEDNLFIILDILLPRKLNVVFNITIVSSDFTKSDEEKLKKFLKGKRPELIYSLQFVKATKEIKDRYNDSKEINLFHDRNIITNNIWIGIGGGFDIFKRINNHIEACKTTTLDVVYPFMTDSDKYKNAYNFLIYDVNQACRELNRTPNNRVLEM